jgi:hypothetical protein
VLIDYRCRVLGGTLASATDVTEARWVRWNELNGHSAYSVRPFTLTVIRKALDQASDTASAQRIITRESRSIARQEEPFP